MSRYNGSGSRRTLKLQQGVQSPEPVQVQGRFDATLNFALIALAALFAWRANRTLVRFGWV